MVALLASAGAYPGPYPPGGSCNVNGPAQICIGAPIGSNAVLQRSPAKAAITGSVPAGYGAEPMTVTLQLREEIDGYQHATTTTIRPDGTWKALLPPRPAFGNYTLIARCTAGCKGDNATTAAIVRNLTF